MSSTLKRLERAVKAGIKAAAEPINPQQKYQASGKPVICSHCGGDTFERINGGLVWAHTLKCIKCSRLDFFGMMPLEVSDS
jgi:hypothetical protein